MRAGDALALQEAFNRDERRGKGAATWRNRTGAARSLPGEFT